MAENGGKRKKRKNAKSHFAKLGFRILFHVLYAFQCCLDKTIVTSFRFSIPNIKMFNCWRNIFSNPQYQSGFQLT